MPDPTPQPDYAAGISPYLSPHGDLSQRTTAAIDKATASIAALMYMFDDPLIAAALIRAIRRGVQVLLIMDASGANHADSQHRSVAAAGGTVLRDATHGCMHHKLLVIDHIDVWTGSANWTIHADTVNAELLIHLSNSPLLASDLERHIHSHAAHCHPMLDPVPLPHPINTDGRHPWPPANGTLAKPDAIEPKSTTGADATRDGTQPSR